MIGPVGLAGDVPAGAHDLGDSLLETLAFLAQNSGTAFSREALRAALGTGRDNEWSPGTISTYVNGLRRVFGVDRVPDATTAGGYRVVGIGTDINRFYELVSLAKTEPSEASQHLSHALSLVRGVPFSGVPYQGYGWADRHDLGDVTTKLNNAVHQTAAELAGLAIDAGNSQLAAWAAEKGLLLWELEEDVNKLVLSAAAISPDRSALARAWAALQRRFARVNEPVPDRLSEHYQELKRQGEQQD
jgi:hypothetical protein